MGKYTITVNHTKYEVEAEPNVPLLWVLRDYLGLKGTKFGCGIAACGACTVHLDGSPVRSCQMQLAAIPTNSKITTIEGIAGDGLHPVQQAWIALQVPQCGYCQSGQIMTTVALLAQNPKPSDQDIDAALTGNLCRCGTYDRIRQAIHLAAQHINH
ncbi:(2Fe-2S)-binding protein [Dyadobacter sp. CY261]|uniref:(2Fe-2S)-binding protein n=1 Tax=Dyadobacter sp. CY261 TaxID=2907203 RepID=UPI001F16AA4B|nr:(2Fe-2S)-binding protein [Dyadobacter sp. CY261]MCF0075001.1 (2Fe-2S)-binding protein [Dyadobacter sp. CY261]